MDSYFTQNELTQLGLCSVGVNVRVSRFTNFYAPQNIRLGNNIRIDDFCILSGKITIRDYFHLGAYSAMYAGDEGITIGSYCSFSSRVTIFAKSDDFSGESMANPLIPMEYKKMWLGSVSIGDFAMIGTGSVIFPGVTMKEGCAVGALSLVKADLPDWTICAGIPAKPIKPRSKNVIELEKQFKNQ